ncbi:hypothetical protein DYBT9275_03104 [Dyadobacter sp. CECT 9275]|uniref:Uncharacterized protein n=1 Tax=Dyadobacter helix TaxID=2822344 RepID=A0A916JCY2_9BACT|nr:hypothetical protein [Dyadobacter sp. CECT 9275]CAG5003230.1 hypothetical protein DYBT9275_03104 [Dyadobacter sp. CECT 9275]
MYINFQYDFRIISISDDNFFGFDGYGIEVYFNLVKKDTKQVVRSGKYAISAMPVFCERTAEMPFCGSFQELWTKRLSYVMFSRLRPYLSLVNRTDNPDILPASGHHFMIMCNTEWAAMPVDWVPE